MMGYVEVMTQKEIRPDGYERGDKIEERIIKVRKPSGPADLDHATHRLSTLASPKPQTQTYHFLRTRISWSLLFRKSFRRLSAHDQLEPGKDRREHDENTSAWC